MVERLRRSVLLRSHVTIHVVYFCWKVVLAQFGLDYRNSSGAKDGLIDRVLWVIQKTVIFFFSFEQ